MKNRTLDTAKQNSPWIRRTFLILMFFVTLTGFGQMPIFKRYYIADIPGLGWLAQFYITHFLHYLTGALLLGLLAFLALDWVLQHRQKQHLTGLGKFKALILTAILFTGLLLALKNFTGYLYPPAVVVSLDLIHLGLVMLYLGVSFMGIVMKRGWVEMV